MTQLLYPNWRDHLVYASGRPQPTVLYETDKVRVIVVGLDAGQEIPLHPEDAAAVFHFLEGTGWVLVGKERLAVKPGATVIVPAGEARGMEAVSRLAFLAARIA